MSRKANPALIGAFVMGAAFLALAALALVGTARFFTRNKQFILYFQESVHGLEEGAKVKFKGVPIGRVKQLRIRTGFQEEDSTAIPVIIEIDASKVAHLGVEEGQFCMDEERMLRQIRNGLRGRLQLESFITGLFFIELDYMPEAEPPLFVQKLRGDIQEIPTSPSAFAEIGQSATEMAARFSALDVKEINEKLIQLLDSLRKAVAEAQIEETSQSLAAAGEAVREFAASNEISRAAAAFRQASGKLETVLARLDSKMDPAFARWDEAGKELAGTLAAVRETAEEAKAALLPESSLRYRLEEALADISAAAAAAHALADYIERNPNAFITGKALSPPAP